MTEQEAIAKIKSLIDSQDNELAHVIRDEVLIQFLKDNGFKELAEAAETIEDTICFWYA